MYFLRNKKNNTFSYVTKYNYIILSRIKDKILLGYQTQ